MVLRTRSMLFAQVGEADRDLASQLVVLTRRASKLGSGTSQTLPHCQLRQR